MHIKIGSQKIEVEVSDGGVFYDKETKLHSSKTLSGLKKILMTAKSTHAPVPIESPNGERKGVILGRVQARGYRRSLFRVRWDDTGAEEEVGSYSIAKVKTQEDKEEICKLHSEVQRTSKIHQGSLEVK